MSMIIVYGDEPLLVIEAARDIKRKATKSGQTIERLSFDTAQQWSELWMAEHHLSLFAHERLLTLETPSLKIPKAAQEALLAFATSNTPDISLLWCAMDYDRAVVNAAWFKKLAQASTVHCKRALSHAQLPRHLHERAHQHQVTLTAAQEHQLLNLLNGNLLAIDQTLAHIQALGGEVSDETFSQILHFQPRANVFTFVDAVFNGDTATATRQLYILQEEQTPLLLVMGAFIKSLRDWIIARQAYATGASLDDAIRTAGIWAQRAPVMKKALMRQPYASGLHLLMALSDLSDDIKHTQSTQTWDVFRSLVLKMATKETI